MDDRQLSNIRKLKNNNLMHGWEPGLVPMLCNVRHATSCWLTHSSCSCCCSRIKNPWLSCVFRVSHLIGIRRRRLSPAQPWPPIVAQFSTSLNNFSSQKQFSFSWFGATWCFLLLDTLISRVTEVESERARKRCVCVRVRACGGVVCVRVCFGGLRVLNLCVGERDCRWTSRGALDLVMKFVIGFGEEE
jgi:hypothetical protein